MADDQFEKIMEPVAASITEHQNEDIQAAQKLAAKLIGYAAQETGGPNRIFYLALLIAAGSATESDRDKMLPSLSYIGAHPELLLTVHFVAMRPQEKP